jgi:alpha-L-fucosidase
MSTISKLSALIMFCLVLYAFRKEEIHGRPPTIVGAPAAVLPIPSEAQMAWHEMELNAFIHFTTNTFTGLEWGKGSESTAIFNPTQLDAGQWVTVLKKAGFKQVILTCKHHDGFCLWPSQYTEHSIKNSPYKNGKGDLVKEVSDACKKQGIRFGVYLSPWDRNRGDYGQPGYLDYYRNQLKELFTRYGNVSEMWFDGANGGDGYYGGANEIRKINAKSYYDWPNTLALVRSIQPTVLFFSDAGPDLRWCGNERGYAGLTNWNTIRNDTLYAGKPGIETLLNTGSEDGDKWIPSEVDVSIRPGWFYHQKEDSLVRSAENLFNIYLSSVGRGSTLLLNVPPDQRGLIHENDQKSLEGFRKLLDDRFKNNLAQEATIKASGFRGNSASYAPSNMNDNKKDSYWCTDDGIKNADIEINLKKKQPVKYIILQEYIKLGQRVKSFTIEAWINNEWRTVANGTTVGFKRIFALENLETEKLRVSIKDAKACPLISNIEVY